MSKFPKDELVARMKGHLEDVILEIDEISEFLKRNDIPETVKRICRIELGVLLDRKIEIEVGIARNV